MFGIDQTMKHLLLVLVALCASQAYAAKDVYVDGYFTNRGTYVQPHHRSTPDNNPYNNYSSNGDTNPCTGKMGTESPYSRSRSSIYERHKGKFVLRLWVPLRPLIAGNHLWNREPGSWLDNYSADNRFSLATISTPRMG